MIDPAEAMKGLPANRLKLLFILFAIFLVCLAFIAVSFYFLLIASVYLGWRVQEGWIGPLLILNFIGTWLLPYPIPSVVAVFAKHPKHRAILRVNLILGWTVVGWFIALGWSVSELKNGDSLRWLKVLFVYLGGCLIALVLLLVSSFRLDHRFENSAEVVLFATLILLPYFIPSIVAGVRRHHQFLPIFAVNLLLGWTILGYLFALLWSVFEGGDDLERDNARVED